MNEINVLTLDGDSKDRCSRTSSKTHTFSYDKETKGTQCSRGAIYAINGSGFCKMHAGEYLLLSHLGELE